MSYGRQPTSGDGTKSSNDDPISVLGMEIDKIPLMLRDPISLWRLTPKGPSRSSRLERSYTALRFPSQHRDGDLA